MLKKILSIGISLCAAGVAYMAVVDIKTSSSIKKSAAQLDKVLAMPTEDREAYAKKSLAQNATQATSRQALKEQAAGFLLGWRMRNVEAYSIVCKKWSVDLSLWAAKIDETVSSELLAAKSIVGDANIVKLREALLQKVVMDSEQELQTLASSQNWNMNFTCHQLNNVASDSDSWADMWAEMSPYKAAPDQMSALME